MARVRPLDGGFLRRELPLAAWVEARGRWLQMTRRRGSNEQRQGFEVRCADLTPPVEKKSQLTLSAQWLLEEPLDGELEAPKTPSPRSWFKCRSNEAMAATK